MQNPKMFSNADMLKLFLPIVIEQFLEYSVGLISSIMAAHVSESAVSGVSLVEFFMALFISIFGAVAAGGAVIIGQYIGAKEAKQAKKVADETLWLCFSISLVVTIVIYLFKAQIFGLLFGSVADSVRASADMYLLIVTASVPFFAIYAACAAIFRTMGNSKLPMYIMFGANIINITLAAVFVYALNLGVLGIAMPVLLSRILSSVAILYLLCNEQNLISITPSFRHKFDRVMVVKILRIGVPFGFEGGMFFFGRIIVLSIVSLFGTAAIAANAVGGTICMFQVLPGMAIAMGFSVIASRLVGANEYEQAKFYTKKVIFIAYITQLFSFLVVFLLLPNILNLYELSSEARELCKQIVWWHGIMMIFIWPVSYVLPVVFRSAGDARFPMIVGVASMFLCRVFCAYLFAVVFDMGMMGTWFAMFVDWAARIVFFVPRYLSGKWMRFRAI